MELEMIDSAGAGILKLKGSWTIERVRELKPAVLEMLRNNEQIIIDLAELTEADLSAVQLLCSAHAEAIKSGKHLRFEEQKSESFKQVVRDAGLPRAIGCKRSPDKGCLWTGDWTS